MINDYKSRGDFASAGPQQGRRHVKLFATLGLVLCVSGIYASFGNHSTNPVSAETNPATTPLPAKIQEPQPLKQLPLQLPGQQGIATATVSNAYPVAALEQKSHAASGNEIPDNQPSPGLAEINEPVAQEAVTEPAENSHDEGTTTETPLLIATQEPLTTPDHGTWQEEKVKRGDSLAAIFSRLKLSPNLLHRIVHSSKEAKSLANIRPGEVIKVRLDQQRELLELVHKQSEIRSLQILPSEDSFTANIKDRSLEKRVASASGTITNSLYTSAQRAGLSDSLTMELANIFGWDIDFALEIRAGDQFSLIYEEEYLDGKKYRNGPILAAEFVNQGKVFRAIRFEDDEGYSSYYSPEGESMRKAFLRAPVDFRRISSRFTKARYHPVLGKKRPHRGVDYAAAIGTPVKASGDGRIIFRGTKGGYGRTVMIRHGSQYTTLYAHLSKFRGGVNTGSRVRQGQVIGYVGKSGLATGPHLHYEFRVNGVHRNPLTIKLPAAEPLAKNYRAKFTEISSHLLAELDLIAKTMVADAR
ncbi:peptidoglycan DD-metalloendopeptidase family protein [Sedimenticola sp.]|uniref:OapA family protein n=1 Tax=Sedimenticola sp. TaxID=1940285 RepID=UPI003D0C60A5